MLDATSFLIYWWIAVPQNMTFEYLPSIYNKGAWKNISWTEASEYRFTNLEPYTPYNVTVYVRIKGTTKEFVPYLYYEVATAEGGKFVKYHFILMKFSIFNFQSSLLVPNAPINVSTSQINGSRVQVSWMPPEKPNGYLEGYSVYYRSQLQRASSPQIVRVGAAELSLIIETDFQGNVTYEFWVKAKNRKHEGLNSKIVQLTFDGTSNIDSIAGLALKHMDDNSMTLTWSKIKKAEGYSVQLVLPHPYPRIEPIRTTETSVDIHNLVNGAQYVARVSAFVKNYTGRSQSLILKRNGAPLPEIQNIQTTREGDNIRLSWSKPTSLPLPTSAKLVYGIYYGTNLEELFDLPKHKTEDTSFLLTNLHECQAYLIGIGIVGPVGPGPLGKNPRSIETHFSERKPPKNLSVSFDDTKKTMEISWDHSCSLSSNRYPNYIISMREVILNQTVHVKVESKTNATVRHTFHEIPRGAKYEIAVYTDVKDAIRTNITATAMPLPAPRLMSIYPEKNGSYVVAWKEVKDMANEK
jgi:sortilin-related receptor